MRRCAAGAVELHCHGGFATVTMIEETLIAAGCQRMTWRDWTTGRRADPIAAAALVALADARTERTAAILLDQYHGALGRALDAIRQSLDCRQPAPGTGPFFGDRRLLARERSAENMDLSPSAAPGTGPFFGDRRLLAGERSAENMDLSPSQQIAILLARANLGRHLVRPWSVVLAGPVNVGKSSLINALAGYGRSIVHDAPGTTRDAVTATTAIDGWPVELCDTAGLRQGGDAVERAGIERAQERLAQADLAVLVFDRSVPWSADDQALVDEWPGRMLGPQQVRSAGRGGRSANRAHDQCPARRRHREAAGGHRPAAGARSAAARRGRAVYRGANGDGLSVGRRD